MHDLDALEWDVILCQETWREERRERFHTDAGHLFLGSRGTAGRCGTGIFIHRRWVHGLKYFRPISERLCQADVNIGEKKYTLAAAYWPHSGQPDLWVDKA